MWYKLDYKNQKKSICKLNKKLSTGFEINIIYNEKSKKWQNFIYNEFKKGINIQKYLKKLHKLTFLL